jgi:hypothetical protein
MSSLTIDNEPQASAVKLRGFPLLPSHIQSGARIFGRLSSLLAASSNHVPCYISSARLSNHLLHPKSLWLV